MLKNPKGSSLSVFFGIVRLFFKKKFHKSSPNSPRLGNFEVFLLFLSLGYGTDLGRSRLVQLQFCSVVVLLQALTTCGARTTVCSRGRPDAAVPNSVCCPTTPPRRASPASTQSSCAQAWHTVFSSHPTPKGAPACARASKSYGWDVRNRVKINPKMAKKQPFFDFF